MFKRFSKGLIITLLLVVTLVLVACGDATPVNTPFPTSLLTPSPPTTAVENAPPTVIGTATKTASGLQYIDVKVGDGAEAKAGQNVEVHYTGYLTNGKKFDSSVDRGQPFPFKLGAGQVIKGWDEGVAGMKIGGKRRLIIPSELGYGPTGSGTMIPPNAQLIFDVELLKVG
ncbi:MAG: FKBP-type peptidyl-prolyl cis-trans isomerase [Chloroflexi bacterium]|nr:FKBP-type peptidyl-prolyl cis-trans isomerase [Chloroflexota bacterium]